MEACVGKRNGNESLRGHRVEIREIDARDLAEHPQLLKSVFEGSLSGVIIRNVFEPGYLRAGCAQLTGEVNEGVWQHPNLGMPGGNIRTIGVAATPTFTALKGPDTATYAQSANSRSIETRRYFGDEQMLKTLSRTFGSMADGADVQPPRFGADGLWAPYNFRALDPGEQIYAHHDNHYKLSIYENLEAGYDRNALLSWFVMLQPADVAGELVIYGLWSTDPDQPVLPTRFLDIAVLEAEYDKHVCKMNPGDVVVFDSWRHVHRVTPVAGAQSRMTLGGFMTRRADGNGLAIWN